MKKFKYLINIILIAIMLFAIYAIVRNFYLESRIEMRDHSGSGARRVSVPHNNENIIANVIEERELKFINFIQGYNVIAILEIPRINLTTNVLEEYSESALNVSVTAFVGPKPNEIGNFVITGHNHQSTSMFGRLNRLEIGDSIYLTDGHFKKVEYVIYDIFRVWPYNDSVLCQNTNGRREITLITCTSDSRRRIIIKARETK
ncbi:MAG: sortase [Oscillospiraceae bacterium]|nr:sortase [Oscillospiraceae bacterium]